MDTENNVQKYDEKQGICIISNLKVSPRRYLLNAKGKKVTLQWRSLRDTTSTVQS